MARFENMKKRIFSLNTIFLGALYLFLLSCTEHHENEMNRVVQLRGLWKFSVGDDSLWSGTGFDDSAWDEILAPSRWEDEGYNDYNGYAWYRRSFSISQVADNYSIYLMFGGIDDVDEVFINGKFIGSRGSFPPYYETAYNKERKYLIPREYLNFDSDNIIAVRVYDALLEGGIIGSPAGIYVDEGADYLDLNLAGFWKFHPGDNKQWKTNDFSDSSWVTINVPLEWENQGFRDYNGYAWYRKEFLLPEILKNKTLYLALGKIDDYDYVYINGKEIGNVFELDRDGEYKYSGYEYNARRIYKIPAGLLFEKGKNLIAVRVYDKTMRGGIYEGPIGIMDKSNYKRYRNNHHSHQSFNEYIIDKFIQSN